MSTVEDKVERLDCIEHDLHSVLERDCKSWVKAYKLMEEVQANKLYEVRYRSFSAWVKDLAIKNGTAESVIWRIKKAGRVYQEYSNLQEERNVKVDRMEDAAIPIESMEIISKIATKQGESGKARNEEVLIDLMDRASKGELTRNSLRSAWQTTREVRTAGESKSKRITTSKADELEKKSMQTFEVVTALSNPEWLPKTSTEFVRPQYFFDKYRTFTEFAVQTGTSKKSRRIDVVAVENMTHAPEMTIHGIEIKVSKTDLKRDHKYTEYCSHVDYMYLAMPEELLSEVSELIPERIGIILISEDKKPILYRESEKMKPRHRMKTLETVIYKSI